MSIQDRASTIAMVPLDRIDPPEIAMRETMDDEGLQDLAHSIATRGLIQPIALRRQGDRYVIVAGHRRFIAHQIAGLPTIKAVIYDEDTLDVEVLKNHENTFREDVNPAEEALYFKRLLDERCDGDVDKLTAMVGRKLSLVLDRLDLCRGYPEVFEALRSRQITLAVALQLNRFKAHDAALMYLQAAIEGGANSTLVRHWRTSHEALGNYMPKDTDPLPDLPAGQAPRQTVMRCEVCGGEKDPYNLEFIYVHRGGPCRDILTNLVKPMRGED